MASGRGNGRFQAVDDRQHGFGKGFDGELAGLGDVFVRTAADVLGLGLGAQIGVAHLGQAAFKFGNLDFGVQLGGRGLGDAGGVFGQGVFGRHGMKKRDRVDMGRDALVLRGGLGNRLSGSTRIFIVQRGRPAIPVRQAAAVLLGRAALLDGGGRFRRQAAGLGSGFAGRDAGRGLGVEELRLGRGAALVGQALDLDLAADGPMRRLSRSPTLTSRDGLTGWPATRTRPRLISSTARARVL